MSELVQIIKYEVVIFLAALAALVAIQLLTGQINTAGLLCGRISGKPRGQAQYFSPGRVQLLVFTLGTAFYYLLKVLENPGNGFPPIPATWPAVHGGSNVIYLLGKTYARWFAGSHSK